jgi:hypothetical protein
MEKRAFRTYLNNNYRDYLKVNCFEYENGYLITDTYSIIKLNQKNDLQVEKDILGVSRHFEDFNMNYEKIEDLELNFNLNEQDILITEEEKRYAINIKLAKRIKRIINYNNVELLRKYNYGYNYIIKLENTKTQEIAFLLPMRSF